MAIPTLTSKTQPGFGRRCTEELLSRGRIWPLLSARLFRSDNARDVVQRQGILVRQHHVLLVNCASLLHNMNAFMVPSLIGATAGGARPRAAAFGSVQNPRRPSFSEAG